MSDQSVSGEDQLGVVLLWTDRRPVGRYGYLTPFRFDTEIPNVLYFDDNSLACQDEQITNGALVHFGVSRREGRLILNGVRLVNFDVYDPRLDFSEYDIQYGMPRFAKYLLRPAGPVFKALREKFSTRLLQSIKEEHEYWRGDFRSSESRFIARRLNAIIRGPLVYDPGFFANIERRSRTVELLQRHPEGNELRFLNRLLLEDAIASELQTAPVFADSATPMSQGRMGDFEDNHRFVIHLQKDVESGRPAKQAAFYEHSFPSERWIPRAGAQVECRSFKPQFPHHWGDALVAYDIWPMVHGHSPKPKLTLKEIAEFKRRLEESMQELAQDSNAEIGHSEANAENNQSAKQENAVGSKEKKETRKRVIVALTPPLQFHCGRCVLIDKNKQVSAVLKPRFADVIRKWFARKSEHSNKLKLILSYKDIGETYLRARARIKRKAPESATADDMDFRKENFPSGSAEEDPEKYATRFSTDFKKELKKYGMEGSLLFFCDRSAQKYVIKRDGWHPTRPMIGRAEQGKKHQFKSHQGQKDAGEGAAGLG